MNPDMTPYRMLLEISVLLNWKKEDKHQILIRLYWIWTWKVYFYMFKLYFNFVFTEDLEKEMRKTFEISDETEVRLWYKYMTNTFKRLSKKKGILQNSALYSGQV